MEEKINGEQPTNQEVNVQSEIVEKDFDGLQGRNCPNCGAPLTHIGSNNCRYCGTPIVEYNIKVWTFSSVREVK